MIEVFIIICVAIILVIANLFYTNKCLNKKHNLEFMSFMESINLTELPVVTFTVKDKKLNFILDTGCTISIINKKLVSTLDVKHLSATSSVFGMEGNLIECGTCLINLEYKGNQYCDQFQILDLDDSFNKIKQESGVNIHGIIGTRFFQKYESIIDFSEFKAYFKKQ